MSEESKWASFVRAHRLAMNLNQGQFAQDMGVSQQTVSRWESGAQIPDQSIQAKLKDRLRATALGSTAFWKYRVALSRGFEMLIDRDMTVLSASKKAAALLLSDHVEGAKLSGLLPERDIAQSPNPGLNSLEGFRDIGFFDGLIRSVRLDMEWHAASGSCACKTDFWPVLTSEQTIIGQFSGMPRPVPADPTGFKGIRVKHVDVRLNKDEVND